jgi:exodeoxyribonuclease VII large subunit
MRTLPSVLQRIAVISSETAAGWQDFKNHLINNDYAYGFDIHFFQSAMQGSLVEKTMLSQLDNIKARATHFDCIVIIRGGGSRLDLSAFDTPSVCEAVAKFPIPVLTGIGHDIDQTVVDMVAHTALKTPTAVADFIVGHNLRFESELLDIKKYLLQYIQEKLHTQGGILSKYDNFIQAHVLFSFKNQKNILENFQQIITKNVQNIVKIEQLKIDNAAQIIDFIGIDATLRRGFSITTMNNQPISNVKDLKLGNFIVTQLLNGTVNSEVRQLNDEETILP